MMSEYPLPMYSYLSAPYPVGTQVLVFGVFPVKVRDDSEYTQITASDALGIIALARDPGIIGVGIVVGIEERGGCSVAWRRIEIINPKPDDESEAIE